MGIVKLEAECSAEFRESGDVAGFDARRMVTERMERGAEDVDENVGSRCDFFKPTFERTKEIEQMLDMLRDVRRRKVPGTLVGPQATFFFSVGAAIANEANLRGTCLNLQGFSDCFRPHRKSDQSKRGRRAGDARFLRFGGHGSSRS
jgi:hypothetical protein